jgi:putative NADH-flavin reductase
LNEQEITMKIALFGSGMIGQRILQEALARGHEVTAITRNPANLKVTHKALKMAKGDATDKASVATLATGHNVVISAIGPGPNDTPDTLIKAAHALIAGVKQAGVKRLLVVGGAGSLEVSPGVLLLESLPEAWRPTARAHRDALGVYRAADVDWTFISPAALIEPGQRTGKYRTGKDNLLTDAKGESRISAEDYAVALLDEVEKPRALRQRITFAY